MANKIKQLKLYKNSNWNTYTISPDAENVNLTVAINTTASNVQDALHTLDTEKAPKSHVSKSNTYGLGDTPDYFGHVALVNDLTSSSYQAGYALSAYQGYVLNNAITGKAPKKHASSTYDEYGVATASNYGHALVKNGVSTVHSTGQALSAYQGYVLDKKIDDNSGVTTFACTRQTQSIQSTSSSCTGIYDKASNTVRLTLCFNSTATSVKIATTTNLYLVPADYRPSAAVYGAGFTITSAINSGFTLYSSAFLVATTGIITQRSSANTNKGFGIIEYTL